MDTFDLAIGRMKDAEITSNDLIALFTFMKQSLDSVDTKNLAVTLDYSTEDELVPGSYLPVITLSLTKLG